LSPPVARSTTASRAPHTASATSAAHSHGNQPRRCERAITAAIANSAATTTGAWTANAAPRTTSSRSLAASAHPAELTGKQ
jgi:hypothetical protein